MIKKIIISSAAMLVLGGCNSAQLTDLANSVVLSPTAPASSNFDKSLASTPSEESARLAAGCIPRMSGGSTSFTQMITDKVVTLAIEAALKEVAGDANVQVPSKIMDTCIADKRLAYLQSLTKEFSNVIDTANKDILASVEQTQEVQKLQAQIDHKKKTLDEAEYNEGVTEDNEKMLVLMENAKVVDKEKYSAAMGKLAIATPINGYMIIGWDKEILEFAKDNIVWGMKNVGAVKDVASQLMTVIEVLPTLSSLATSPLYDGRVDPDIAKQAGADQMKEDEEVAKLAAEDNGFGDEPIG